MTLTNEQRRRASGDAMERSRRDSGAAMEASRRAGGEAMIKRRTGKSVADDIQSLVQPPRQAKPLPRIDPVGALPAQKGRGTSSGPATGGATGGGIASPLTEQTVQEAGVAIPDREFWPNQIMTSTDGLRVWEIRPIRTWRFTDADGNPVVLHIARPKQDFA